MRLMRRVWRRLIGRLMRWGADAAGGAHAMRLLGQLMRWLMRAAAAMRLFGQL